MIVSLIVGVPAIRRTKMLVALIFYDLCLVLAELLATILAYDNRG
jgi:hypothetical protein